VVGPLRSPLRVTTSINFLGGRARTMGSIKDIVSELGGIPHALGNDASDPRRRPWISTAAPVAEQITERPVVDSSRWEVSDQVRWEEQKVRARQLVEGEGHSSEGGIEALAWYVSFHHNQELWGIYIPLSSLALLDELYLSQLRMDRDQRLGLAWSILLHHEQTHFAVDYACAQFELLLRAPIRREFSNRFRAEPPINGLTGFKPYLRIEETAANAHMLRQLARTESKRTVRTIENFVRLQPPGYREGLDAMSNAAFAASVAETLRSYLAIWAMEYRLDLGSHALNLEWLLPLEDKGALAECPVYAIDDLSQVGVASGSLSLIQCIAEVIELDGFKKQLRKQHNDIQNDWSNCKDRIKVRVPAPPRFEKLKGWKPPTWSLRLRDGHRVHLQPPEPGAGAWRAVAIGNHKEMGHG